MTSAATRVCRLSRLLAVVIITIAVVLIPASIAAAQCIENSLWGCVDIWYGFTTWPGASLVWESPTGISPWTAGEPCPLGCYDLRGGLLEVKAWGAPWGQQCGGDVFTGDRFRVLGATGSDPIQFSVEFWVDGVVNGPDVLLDAAIREPSDPTGASERVTGGPVQLRLTIPLSHAPEEEFVVLASLRAWATGPSGDAHASGVVHFSGLPRGAYVASCQGYNLPVPTLPTSWGQVKALYR